MAKTHAKSVTSTQAALTMRVFEKLVEKYGNQTLAGNAIGVKQPNVGRAMNEGRTSLQSLISAAQDLGWDMTELEAAGIPVMKFKGKLTKGDVIRLAAELDGIPPDIVKKWFDQRGSDGLARAYIEEALNQMQRSRISGRPVEEGSTVAVDQLLDDGALGPVDRPMRKRRR